MVELRFLSCDPPGAELHFYLGEPDLWIGRPERRELQVECRNLWFVRFHRHRRTSWSPIVGTCLPD